ncbi:MAG: MogA/MoaB family molybdenum cofactor biosynthesis protein [Elusimicrobiota bacterium]
MIKTAILTISSTRTAETDFTGDAVFRILQQGGFDVIAREIVGDDKEKIFVKLVHFSDVLEADLVLTAGGTGGGPYDVTPEATLDTIDRLMPGLSELMRAEGIKKTKKAALSRGVSGIRKSTLIINLPGSPNGAGESLDTIIDILPHAVDVIKGAGHPADKEGS